MARDVAGAQVPPRDREEGDFPEATGVGRNGKESCSGDLICPLCGAGYQSQQAIYQHLRQTHKCLLPFQISGEGRSSLHRRRLVFWENWLRASHFPMVSLDRDAKSIRAFQQKYPTSEADAAAERTRRLTKSNRPLDCPLCEQLYSSQQSILFHLRKDHKVRITPMSECRNYIQGRQVQQDDLNRHTRARNLPDICLFRDPDSIAEFERTTAKNKAGSSCSRQGNEAGLTQHRDQSDNEGNQSVSKGKSSNQDHQTHVNDGAHQGNFEDAAVDEANYAQENGHGHAGCIDNWDSDDLSRVSLAELNMLAAELPAEPFGQTLLPTSIFFGYDEDGLAIYGIEDEETARLLAAY